MKTNNSGSKVLRQSCQGQFKQNCENQLPYDQRVTYFEQNLNRVCLQQDALMPLLQMIEYIPSIQKSDANVKQLIKRSEENQNKIARIEKCLDRKIKEAESKPQKNPIAFEEVQEKVKDLEQNMNNLYRWYEAKLKEESQSIARSLDQKIDKHRSDLEKSCLGDSFAQDPFSKTVNQSIDSMRADFSKQIAVMKEEVKQIKASLY